MNGKDRGQCDFSGLTPKKHTHTDGDIISQIFIFLFTHFDK